MQIQNAMNQDWFATARTLSEALPYLQRYDDAVVVIKFGGHAMAVGLSLSAEKYESFKAAFDKEARRLLVKAFVEEVFEDIENEALGEALVERIESWLDQNG